MLELRAFQRITDLLGHDVGDRVLMTVADALRREVGEAGMVARLSGDQFLVALDDVRSGDEAAASAAGWPRPWTPPRWNPSCPHPHPSVGVASAPADGSDSRIAAAPRRAPRCTAPTRGRAR